MNITYLANFFFAALTTWCPIKIHEFTHVPQALTEARYHSIANDLAEVVLDPDEKPIFAGEDGRVRTGLLIAAIASFESGGFASKIDKDIYGDKIGSGDGGSAHCLMQVHPPYSNSIIDRKTCFRAGLKALHDTYDHCHSMNNYVSNNCQDSRGLAKVYMKRATSYYAAHPFVFEQEVVLN